MVKLTAVENEFSPSARESRCQDYGREQHKLRIIAAYLAPAFNGIVHVDIYWSCPVVMLFTVLLSSLKNTRASLAMGIYFGRAYAFLLCVFFNVLAWVGNKNHMRPRRQ